MNKAERITYLKNGIKDGMPIALGYLAVAFSLGIQAKNAGINAFYASLMSLLNVTSAGQFAAIGIIAVSGGMGELALSQLIINLRYMLMSCSLSQKIPGDTKLGTRLLMSFGITDEIFGISIGQKNYHPIYTLGAMLVAIPGWTIGTGLGVICGNILPGIIVSALSIALYGMFLAIIIPPAKTDKSVAGAVIIAMITSFVFSVTPVLKEISAGNRVIILTLIISFIFAVLFPIPDESNETADREGGPA